MRSNPDFLLPTQNRTFRQLVCPLSQIARKFLFDGGRVRADIVWMKHALLPLSLLLLAAAPKPLGTQGVLDATQASDWRQLDPANTLYMETPTGRVVIELAPDFAPNHAANIRTLARERWFDGVSINRVQENYVTQWGDATEKKPMGSAKAALAGEITRSLKGLSLARLPSRDTYAPISGFAGGFPVAASGGKAWLAHCYGMVGSGRGDGVDSGSGAELYAVIGQAARHLDRNITVVGRVIQGMENLTALPRGTGALGFYEKEAERVPIKSVRLAADVPEGDRTRIELLRTDTPAWKAYVDVRSHRTRDGFFVVDAGAIDLCNIRVPVRPLKAP